MKRREFITLLGGAIAWPVSARAQQVERMRRIGFWVGEPERNVNAQRRVAAFRQGLQNLNWKEGHNVTIDYRWAILNLEGLRADAASLVALQPDVIVTTGAPTVAALLQLTQSIPIIFTFVTDPVKDGFVKSLSHPGGNITGFTISSTRWPENGSKYLRKRRHTLHALRSCKTPNIRHGQRT